MFYSNEITNSEAHLALFLRCDFSGNAVWRRQENSVASFLNQADSLSDLSAFHGGHYTINQKGFFQNFRFALDVNFRR